MRIFPEQTERVESGPIQFGNDWPGLFLRGDDAFGHSLNILMVWQYLKERYKKENMPLELHLAMMGLASVFDMVQDEVVVGGRIVKESPTTELVQKYSERPPVDLSEAVTTTIHHPEGLPSEPTHE